ncbi:MAG: SDR family oxidoreductase [Reyranellaceae bacterium]
MRVLLTGANGFIGAQLLVGLRARGHVVVAAVRDVAAFGRRWPGVDAIPVDFNRDTAASDWRSRLAGIDAVINCAGVLQGGRGQDIEAIHATSPIALFDACVEAGVRRVVQISAISADDEAGTPYSLTKKRADDHLRRLDLDGVVLRPSLVYGDGSYGGTSTIRGLAGLPYVTPIVGSALAIFRPLHIDDLVEAVARVLSDDRLARRTLEPVGPDKVTLAAMIAQYRAWLGLPPARPLEVPLPIARLAARLADLSGGGPMGSAGLRQLLVGNAGSEPDGVFAQAVGFVPASLAQRLAVRPAQTQDLWHARLYFVRPLLRAVLAALWIGSGLAGLLAPTDDYRTVAASLEAMGLPARALAFVFGAVDLAIAWAIVRRWRPRLMAAAQVTVIAGYTLGLSILGPALWLDPFGALLKNLPILGAVAAWAALEEER